MPATTESIEELEKKIHELKGQLAELRRKQPRQPVENYGLVRSDGTPTDLHSLFVDKRDLIIVHNMGRSCTYCTLWADGYNGFTEHIRSRAGFAVVSPDPPEVQIAFAASRGWRFPMVSDQEGRFTRDMGYLTDEDDFWPGVSTFRMEDDGTITRVANTFLGPGDDFCAIWPMFEMLADGPAGWEPKYKFE